MYKMKRASIFLPKVETGPVITPDFVPLWGPLRLQRGLIHSRLPLSWLSCAFAILVAFPSQVLTSFFQPPSSFTCARHSQHAPFSMTHGKMQSFLHVLRQKGCPSLHDISKSVNSLGKMRGCLSRYIHCSVDWIVINGRKLMGFLKT